MASHYSITDRLGRVAVSVVLAFTFLFLVLPLAATLMISFDPRAYLAYLPLPGFSLRWYQSFLESPRFMDGLRISLLIGGIAAMTSTIVAIFASYSMVRYDFKGKETLNTIFLSPMIDPEVVTGFALLGFLTILGLRASFVKLLIGHIIIVLPYAIRTVSATLVGFDRSLEEAALNLRATPVQTFLKVTLPLIKPGVIAAVVFAFATSLDDVAVSIFLVDPFTTTLPVALFAYMKAKFDPTVAAASILLTGFTFGFILALEKTLGLDRFAGI